MTRIPAPAGTVARSRRRPQLALATTVLAALALAACGTRQTAADGSHSRPADVVSARRTDAPAASGQQAAFIAMLNGTA
ncbi:hypothetical protein [Streptomyces sp. NPDC090445]|uniref:hypothetical protein n=1 Tax=Streptomyces sp. NPDC090445 TaxID=3365963 RepID=UPI00381C8942